MFAEPKTIPLPLPHTMSLHQRPSPGQTFFSHSRDLLVSPGLEREEKTQGRERDQRKRMMWEIVREETLRDVQDCLEVRSGRAGRICPRQVHTRPHMHPHTKKNYTDIHTNTHVHTHIPGHL